MPDPVRNIREVPTIGRRDACDSGDIVRQPVAVFNSVDGGTATDIPGAVGE